MIVIPMAGLSSRFFNYGYKIPKYMLDLDGVTVFEHSVRSFERYFATDKFIFICRDILGTCDFVREKASAMGLLDFEIKVLEHETRGQAETVMLGLVDVDPSEEILIFNIDTFRPGYTKPNIISDGAGYLETFIGAGENWSYILEGRSGEVVRVTEKVKISDHCCTGIYYFRRLQHFREAFYAAESNPELMYKNELYVAPLYNVLIKNGLHVGFLDVDTSEVVFCGTPDEYLSLGGSAPEETE